MKILWILLLAVTAVTVSGRHRKEWQKVDLTKIARERPQIFYKSDKPACARGAGYYRDPQDCHRFIRCVDEYGNGRHFTVFSGRCEPGLVFDENVSACNWPELAAPCSNSPPRLQEVRKPLKPEQVPQENAVYEEKNWNDRYPQQQEVVPDSQVSGAYETQQKEVPVVQEIQVTAQEPIYQEKIEQTFVETQEPFQEQAQEQIHQGNVQAVVVQEQAHQENVQSPELQEQVYEETGPQERQNIENVQAFEQSAQNEQNVIQTEQQVVYQEQSNQNEVSNQDPIPKQGSSSGFQHVVDQQNQQLEISQQSQQGELSQQESQSKWWVPEDKPQYSPPEPSEQISTSDSNQPIFCSEEGFYRHPDNCSQFIRCVKIGAGAFAVHFFECPKQLVFSDKDSACIVADTHSCRSRTKRQASNTKLRCSGEGFFRHPEDCRAFYRCVKSATGFYETHQFSCPANLVFDEEYTTCNWPDKAPPCDSQQQYKPTRKPVKPVQTERTTYRPPSRTTSRGSWSTPKKESRTTTKPRNDVIDESIAQLSNRKRNTQKPKSTTPSYESGPRCRSPGFYRNDNDCTKFYKCVKKGNNFIRYDLSCPQNFAYDDSAKRCVSQRYVSSCNRNRRPRPPLQNDEETTAAPEATSAGSSDSESGNDASACKEEGYYRNPEDCNKFYRCVDFNGNGEEFVRYDFNCPEGLVFDEENSVCNWPDQSAPCDTSGGGSEGTGGDSDDGSESGGNGESDGTDSETEVAETSSPSEQPSTESVESTSSSSVDSNEEQEGSDKDSNESDSNKESGGSGSENECTKEGFYRNPDDCNKFYRCVDHDGEGKEFVRYDFSCPEGLVFDEANSVCNWPSDSEPCDTRSGGGNEGGNGQDGESSTEPSSPGRESESSADNQDQNKQTTPSETGSTADGSTPAGSTEGSSESSTESSNGNKDGSRGGGSNGNTGECTEEGFFRDPEDCNKFYRCVDQNGNGEFIKYDFTCPEGLVFDESNSVCNWPDQSAPCDGGSSGKGESSTSETGNGDSESSEATTSSSGSSNEVASESSSTSSTTQSTDSESSRSTTEKSETTPSESGGNESTSDSSENGSKGNEGECTEEGFFRNPEDCNKFYRCVDFNGDGEQFTRYDFECPEGLVFDEVNSVCNWPDQSPKCEAKSGSGGNETTDSSSESSTSQTESSGEQTKSPTEQSTQSSAYETTQSSSSTTQSTSDGSTTGGDSECTEPGFYRCKDDCSKFYRCVEEDGKLVRYDFKCPDGLIFDDKNKKCDWPSSELSCDTDSAGTSTTSTYESSTSGTSTTSAYESSTSGTSTQSSSSSGSSDKECTEEGFFRDPDDCSKYYRCLDEGDGTFSKEEFSCAEDEVFDEEMRYCNRKDLAPPCESPSGSSDSECKEPGFYRSKDDCSKFYRCVEEDGKLVKYDFQCPDGLIFDDKNKKCDWPSSELKCEDSSSTSTTSAYESTTQSSSSSESSNKECTEEGFFRDPDDCSKYYRCLDEGDGTFSREDFSCAEDEVFDEEMRYCNRKDLAPPCDGSQTESTSSSATSGESQSTTQRTTTTTQSTTESSTKGGSSSECSEPGFYRCPEDCTKFYRCVEEDGNMVRYDFKCPDGLIFDEKNKKCDWPSSELTCDTESTTSSSSSTESSQTGGTTSKSGTESSSSGECTEEGFFRNPDDCSKYYRCTDEGDGTFTREDFACEEDEVFDEEMRYCNRKDLAPPCDDASSTTESSGGSTSSSTASSESESTSGTTSASSGSGECTEEGFHRDPNDCSKFYRCVDFEGDGKSFTRYDFDCPEGLVFDESNDVCNWPSSVPSCESGSKSGGSTSDGSSTTSETSDYSTSSTAATEQTSTTTSEQRSTTSREQTSTTPSGSDSTDGTQEQSSTTSTSSERGTTSSGGTGSRGSGSSDNIECTEEGFFRHPEDCSKFYRCVDFAGTGESYVRYDFDCPEGLVFDEVNSVCNWPNQSPGCESGSRGESDNKEGSSTDSGSTSESSSSDNSQTTQSASTTTSRDQTTRSATSTTSSGEFRCEEEGYYRHPSDCRKYYECKRDEETGELEKIDCECPEGQVWDNEGWYCNAEELSPPCDSSSNGSSFKCTEEGFFRDPEDCTRYYVCNRTGSGSDEFTSERRQCDEGLVFDEEGRYCNAPELSEPCDDSSSTSSSITGGESSKDGESNGSTSSGSSSGQCTNEGYFRDPEDCTKYYQCTRNEDTGEFDKTDYSCPDGRIFDEGSNYCNEPELSEQPCDSGSQPTTTRQSNTESSSTGDNGSTSSSGTRRGGGDPECTQEGFFRHPEDCNKFYRCVDFSGSGESFVRYDFDCPEGLHFDEVNSVCNWPTMTPPCESSNRLFFKYKPV